MADIEWLKMLILEYQYRDKGGELRLSRTPEQVDSMKQIFAHVDQDVMLDAARQYILQGHYFPKPADLWPHVQEAQEKARGQDWEAGRLATDTELYEMELARGTMPPLDELHDYWPVIARAAVGEWQADMVPA